MSEIIEQYEKELSKAVEEIQMELKCMFAKKLESIENYYEQKYKELMKKMNDAIEERNALITELESYESIQIKQQKELQNLQTLIVELEEKYMMQEIEINELRAEE